MRKICKPEDVEGWFRSEAHQKLLEFITKLSDSVKGLKVSEIEALSLTDSLEISIYTHLKELLKRIRELIMEVPPLVMQNQRYGNKAFRTLIDKMQVELEGDSELTEYLRTLFLNSWGNCTRIDYGTGHELFFIIFVMVAIDYRCKQQQNHDMYTCSDSFFALIAVDIIGREYVELVKLVLDRYSLEPAGSHGVWGLDDYQFYPFLMGSAQLIGHEDDVVSPSQSIEETVLKNEVLTSEYLYLGGLKNVQVLKTRGNATLKFAHHSPLLYDISGIASWQRIHDGLKRMYLKEVLSKFPVIQHLLFDEQYFVYHTDRDPYHYDHSSNTNDNDNTEV